MDQWGSRVPSIPHFEGGLLGLRKKGGGGVTRSVDKPIFFSKRLQVCFCFVFSAVAESDIMNATAWLSTPPPAAIYVTNMGQAIGE